MRNIRLCLIALVVVAFTKNVSAQNAPIHGREDKKSEINFTELANYYRDHPTPEPRRMPFDEDEKDEEVPVRPEPDPSLVHTLHRSAARQNGSNITFENLPMSVPPLDSFLATQSNGSFIPPDTHGGVDSNYCVTAINMSVHIQKRNGTNVSTTSLDNFWTSMLASGGGSFDPRIHYDPYAKRWIIVTLAYGQSANSQIMIGVSKTSNPTMGWWLYKVHVGTSSLWLDFPNVGFNNQWVVVTGNFFNISSGASSGSAAYVFDKAAMMAGTGAPYTKLSPSGFSVCPAITYDPSASSMFLVDVYNSGSGKLRLRKITGPVGAPVLSGTIGYPTSTLSWGGSGSGGSDFAAQLGTTNKLDAGDDRITNLTFRNNKLWCAFTAFMPASSPTRCSAMWWEMDTLANPLQIGLLDDPATPTFFAYPTITVNSNNDALMGFAYLNKNVHPSAAYAIHLNTDPVDSMRPFYVYRHGKNTYYQNFGSGKNRFGDYSATCVDPVNNIDFWTIQESVPTTANIWDTWWAHISLSTSTSLAIENTVVPMQGIKILPNPNNGKFDILLSAPVKNPVTVKITALDGRSVYDHQFSFAQNNRLAVDTDNLAPGVYVANVYVENDVFTEKITINR